MSVILFIVNVLLSGRRALSELFPGFEQDLMRHGAVPLRAGLGVRIEHPGDDPFPQRDLGWSSYACHGRQSSAPCDGGWKLLATALAPTWSGPAGFSRQYDEIMGVPILQHSPKKGSRDRQFGRLFVAWVERPASFRVGQGVVGNFRGDLNAEIRNCGCCVFGFGGSGGCRGSASSAARRPDRSDW